MRSWNLSHKSDTAEDTTMGDAAKTFQATLTEWDGSLTCFWDETDATGQGALTAGASVTLNLYPEGATSTDTYYSGAAIVTSIDRSGAHDGMVEANFAFKGSGALSTLTV